MDTVKTEPIELFEVEDLKPLLSASGPCFSLYLQLGTSSDPQGLKVNSLAWKELVSTLTTKANGHSDAAKEVSKTIGSFEETVGHPPHWAKSAAVFRSPDLFRVTFLHEHVQNRAELGDSFYVRPLLPELTKATAFYVLALSQKNVRLLRCTLDNSEEVALGAQALTSYDEYMNAAQPDHASVKRGAAGAGAGTSKGIVGTTASEREHKGEYLHHFFKQVNVGVAEALHGRTEPLVPVGVDYELALYRTINSYPHLVEQGVHGAANGLKAGEMHARAIEALSGDYEAKLDAALAEYDHKAGGGASNRLKDIVTAAHDGRVVTLIVSDSLEARGQFDEQTNQTTGGRTGEAGGQDLINDAVVQTILHNGNVLVANTKKMPNGAPAAAIFRY